MCPCKKYDCNGGFQETCGFSEGFCDMMLHQENSPVEYKINYVRVYQDKDDPMQKVGCSTPERPTRKFIEAHQKKYKLEGDVSYRRSRLLAASPLSRRVSPRLTRPLPRTQERPLKPIQTGGGPCSPSAAGEDPRSCGGPARGTCRPPGACLCLDGWTGPHCLNPAGFDDVVWDPPDALADLGFRGPSLKRPSAAILVVALAGTMLLAPAILRKRRRTGGGYRAVPSRASECERRA